MLFYKPLASGDRQTANASQLTKTVNNPVYSRSITCWSLVSDIDDSNKLAIVNESS